MGVRMGLCVCVQRELCSPGTLEPPGGAGITQPSPGPWRGCYGAHTQSHCSAPCTAELEHAGAHRNNIEVVLNTVFLPQPWAGPFPLATGWGWYFLPVLPQLCHGPGSCPHCPSSWPLSPTHQSQARKKQPEVKGTNPTLCLPLCPKGGAGRQPAGDVQTPTVAGLGKAVVPALCPLVPL